MAKRRMFSKELTESDTFLDMPAMTQALYFHYVMQADDDGFICNPKSIQRLLGATDDDLKLLIANGYIIRFGSGHLVVRHWKLSNEIPKDRYNPTIHQSEMSMLTVKGKVYDLSEQSEYTLDTERIQDGYSLDTQIRLGKERLGEVSQGKKTDKRAYGEFGNVLLSDDELNKLKERFADWSKRIEQLSCYMEMKNKKYKSHYATILTWAEKNSEEVKANASRDASKLAEINKQLGNYY